MNHSDEKDMLKALLVENQRLLRENNTLLRKMRRSARWAFAFRMLWFAMLLGVPVALYYFLLEPNLQTLERSYSILQMGTEDMIGMREFFDSFERQPE